MRFVQATFENGNVAVVCLEYDIRAIGETEDRDPEKVWHAFTKAKERDPRIVGFTKLKSGSIVYYADYTFLLHAFPGPTRIGGTWSSESI